MSLYQNGKRFAKYSYKLEEEFEKDIVANYKLFFGKNCIYIDSKRKIDTKAMGASIPDGFLFDLSDIENPEFYIIEAELAKHDFYNHIFPQITKFFAFFKNPKSQRELIEKIYSTILTDDSLNKEFKKFLGDRELYKFLNDSIESSRNILMVIDDEKKELPEIIETYTDTWGKIVKIIIIEKYHLNNEFIYSTSPDFENIEYLDAYTPYIEAATEKIAYSEEYHLDGVTAAVKAIYSAVKGYVESKNGTLQLNPQKHYISIVHDKNIAYMKFRKKKVRMVVKIPQKDLEKKLKFHALVALSESVQRFYNGESVAIDIESVEHIKEVFSVLDELVLKAV